MALEQAKCQNNRGNIVAPGIYGADIAELRTLSKSLAASGARLTSVGASVTSLVQSAAWKGRDGDTFRGEWSSTLLPLLHRTSGSPGRRPVSGSGPPLESRADAVGFAQRRSWVFYAWWYPAILALSGAVHALISLLVGADPELGTVLLIIGAALSALGWAVTAAPRFTRKDPKPASDIPRVDQGIRITPRIIWTILCGTAAIVLALVLFTPKGTTAEAAPLLSLPVSFACGVAGGLAYTRNLMINSSSIHKSWLQRRKPPRGS